MVASAVAGGAGGQRRLLRVGVLLSRARRGVKSPKPLNPMEKRMLFRDRTGIRRRRFRWGNRPLN